MEEKIWRDLATCSSPTSSVLADESKELCFGECGRRRKLMPERSKLDYNGISLPKYVVNLNTLESRNMSPNLGVEHINLPREATGRIGSIDDNRIVTCSRIAWKPSLLAFLSARRRARASGSRGVIPLPTSASTWSSGPLSSRMTKAHEADPSPRTEPLTLILTQFAGGECHFVVLLPSSFLSDLCLLFSQFC